jgi:hypothetical protein
VSVAAAAMAWLKLPGFGWARMMEIFIGVMFSPVRAFALDWIDFNHFAG